VNSVAVVPAVTHDVRLELDRQEMRRASQRSAALEEVKAGVNRLGPDVV